MSKIELFKEKIKNKELIIGVIGLGYVGLPLSVLASQKGYQVYGFDINKRKVNMLLNNKNYISDVDDEVLKEVIKENKFIPTSNFRFLDKVDVIIICVPTPLNKKGKPDLSCLYKAINEVSKYLKDDIIVIILMKIPKMMISSFNKYKYVKEYLQLIEELSITKVKPKSKIIISIFKKQKRYYRYLALISNINLIDKGFKFLNTFHSYKIEDEKLKKKVDAFC